MSIKTLGRDVVAVLLDETLLEGDGSTVKIIKGHLFCKIAEAESGSAIGTGTLYEDLEPGYVNFAKNEITLADGDKVVDLGDLWAVENLIGYGRDKDITMSKTSVDMTVDEDEYTDMRSDGLVGLSGNVNGYMLNNIPETSATFRISQQFMDTVVQDDTGTAIHKKSTPIVVMAYLFGKEVKTGDEMEVWILPCQFTSDGASVSYGAATAKNMAWSGNSRSNQGVLPQKLMATAPEVA